MSTTKPGSVRSARRLGRVEIAVFLSGLAVAAGLLCGHRPQCLHPPARHSVGQRDPRNSGSSALGPPGCARGRGRRHQRRSAGRMSWTTSTMPTRTAARWSTADEPMPSWVEPLVDPGHAAQAAELCDGLTRYRDLVLTVLADPVANGEGTAFDDEIDGLLEELTGLTEDLAGSLDQAIADDASDLSLLGKSLAAGVVLLGLAVALLASRHRRQLAAQNHELARTGRHRQLDRGRDQLGVARAGRSPAGTGPPRRSTAIGLTRSSDSPPVSWFRRSWLPASPTSGRRAGAGAGMTSFDSVATRKDGSLVSVSLTISPLFDGDDLIGMSTISRDITERQARELELATARNQALEASVLKSQFLATMSHEIRTPLNGVMGLNGLLLETQLDEIQRQYSEGVQGAGEALLGVINDILEFSRLEAGKVDYENVEFDPRGLVEEMAALLAVAAHKQASRTGGLLRPGDFRHPARRPGAHSADPAQSGRQRGEVHRIRARSRSWSGSSDADGDDSQVLFEVATPVSASPRRTSTACSSPSPRPTPPPPGATAAPASAWPSRNDWSTAWAGQIGVESEAGAGSRFWFALPLASVPGARRNSPPSASTSLAGVRVLVVDDNATNRLILLSQLTAWDMRPDAVADGPFGAAATPRRRVSGAAVPDRASSTT